MAAGIVVTYLLSLLQDRASGKSPDAINEQQVAELKSELREQVRISSFGSRRDLIEDPLKQLDLDVEPRVGWVRDHRLAEPISEKLASIIAAFYSSERRLLVVGEPGAGKTMAAYSLIEHLDETEGDQRIPLLVNLSAWEAQETVEAFLVDYLCSSVGYEVTHRAVASAYIRSRRYSLILDGLDEIPARLRTHFCERLDEFIRRLPSEVAVVVTCRTEEYAKVLDEYRRDRKGLGLVQAVEILPLTEQQLDRAFVELAKHDEEWKTFLSQRHLGAHQRVRELLSTPLFLNLAAVGHLNPNQLLDWTTTDQELRDLVIDRYLDRTLADQREYEPADARHYLTWIARFLNGAEISSDAAVFELGNITPPNPPNHYRLCEALVYGLVLGLFPGLLVTLEAGELTWNSFIALRWSLLSGLACVSGAWFMLSVSSLRVRNRKKRWLWFALWYLILWLVLLLGFFLISESVWFLLFPFIVGAALGAASIRFVKTSALPSRLALLWPSNRQQCRDILRQVGRRVLRLLKYGLVFGLGFGGLGFIGSFGEEGFRALTNSLILALALTLASALAGLVFGLGFVLIETRRMLITFRAPKEASSRSLIAALIHGLIIPLLAGLTLALATLTLVLARALTWLMGLETVTGISAVLILQAMSVGLFLGLIPGVFVGLNSGGWFVLLQKVAHRRLARAGNLPLRPYDFLQWGIETQIFRRVGAGVRFRHNLIQQHLASTSADA
jgi:GTPase SAR1 family protein